jgi:hypothetical protein
MLAAKVTSSAVSSPSFSFILDSPDINGEIDRVVHSILADQSGTWSIRIWTGVRSGMQPCLCRLHEVIETEIVERKKEYHSTALIG